MWRRLRPALPPDWTVRGLTDRGLSARWLLRRMVRLGWHPFVRSNQGAKFRPAGQARWDWLRALVGQVGHRWRGGGTAFRSRDCHLEGTLGAWGGRGP